MSLMKTLEIPKSGKCGGTVWQRNRFCQYSYPAFVPFNPRTPAQVAVRGTFGAVSKRWRTLTQEQHDAWIAVAPTIKSKPRLFQCGALTGCQLFVKRNVSLVNQGKPQVDLPTEGRSKNEECRNMTPKAVPGLLGGVFVSKRDTGSRGTHLRYRACTGVIPYQHARNTLAGRCVHRCPQERLRFPCRSQPPACLLPGPQSLLVSFREPDHIPRARPESDGRRSHGRRNQFRPGPLLPGRQCRALVH